MDNRRAFYGMTVEAALAQARYELGEGALLVSSRRTTADEAHLGAYEVVAQSESAAGTPVSAAKPMASPAGVVSTEPLAGQLAELKQELSRVSRMVGHFAVQCSPGLSSELATQMAALVTMGMDGEYLFGLAAGLQREFLMSSGSEPGTIGRRASLYRAIERLCQVDPEVGVRHAERKRVALVGPPGCGKTSTLAKMAVQLGIAEHRSAAIVSCDSFRIGASDQMRSYAAILGLPFVQVEHPTQLARALEELRSRDLVLVDTAGFSPRESDLNHEWSEAMGNVSDLDVQLVINATGRGTEMERSYRTWSSYRPSRLVFTHIDEVESTATALCLSLQLSIPVSFLCSGQSVPEDMEAATRERLLRPVAECSARLKAAVAA